MSDGIHDQAVMIGARKTLVGIMTQPVDYEPEDRPVFVILNSGIIHRVGHHRMYVTLARALARVGYPVLRFDLSGIGDSESREDGLSMLDAALADVREVVDWLVHCAPSAQGYSGRVVLGCGPGARLRDLRSACLRARVARSVHPPTRQYHVRRFLRRLSRRNRG